MIHPALAPLVSSLLLASAGGGPIAGKAAFMAVFALVFVWVLVMPARFIAQGGQRLPWWKNARFWAALVALVEIAVYWRFG